MSRVSTAKSKRQASRSKLPPFDKYKYYLASVQSPREDMQFLELVYQEARGQRFVPKVFREDFCGTFANCAAWVERGPDRVAHGVDLDPEPLAWGREHHLNALEPEQRERLHLYRKDVLKAGLPKADIICALNFSYFIFKEREMLKRYFANCLRTLNERGVLVLDCFGGSACQEPNEEETEYEDPPYSYFWDQDSFDPINNHAVFYIHFKRRGEKKRLRVFEYDWRMWSIPEIRDLLHEVGFKKVNVYWEGVTKDGYGNGLYEIAEKGDECESWVTYIAALK